MTDSLSGLLSDRQERSEKPAPQFFNAATDAGRQGLARLLQEHAHVRVIDTYQEQLKELLVIEKPWLYMDRDQLAKDLPAYVREHCGSDELWQAGVWVYLPWRHTVQHILADEQYQMVRTARNRNLITAQEQRTYYQSTVTIAGLSVGNSVALSLVLTGGAKRMRLADPDTVELTNLNRIRGSVAELTEPKVYMTARQIYELDPYAELTLYTDGVTEENINEVCDGADVIIDEIDNLGMKIRLRQEAKRRKLPVVMAADNGDGGILDIERHDLDANIAPFHGRAGEDIADRVVGKKLPPPVIGQIITEDLLGAETVMPRMQQSLLAMGSEIPTWPQLGGAALLNGVAVAAAVRRIVTGQPVINNRALLALESWVEPGFDAPAAVAARQQGTSEFLTAFHERLNAAAEQSAGS